MDKYLCRREFLVQSALLGLSLATAPANAAPAASTKLRFYDWKLTSSFARPVLERILAEFRKQNPNIDVALEEVGWNDHLTKLIVLAQGGIPPAVVHLTAADVLPLVNIQALEPLTGWAQKANKDGFLTKIPTNVRKSLQFQGKDYLACNNVNIDCLTWNKQLFEKAGLDPEQPPKTWDQLVEYARKLTDPSKDQYGWGIMSERAPSATRRVVNWIVSGGGAFFNEDGTEVVANSEGGLRGFQFWAELALKHKVTPPGAVNATFRSVLTGYGQGKIAMFDGGSDNPTQADADFPGILAKTNLGPIPNPWRPQLAVEGYAVMSGTADKEAAFKLCEWMASVYGQVEYALGVFVPPIRSDAAIEQRIKNSKVLSQVAAQIGKGVPSAALHPKWAEIEQKLLDAMGATLSGAKTAKQALDDFASEGNKILKRTS